jgi:hypothetical protein
VSRAHSDVANLDAQSLVTFIVIADGASSSVERFVSSVGAAGSVPVEIIVVAGPGAEVSLDSRGQRAVVHRVGDADLVFEAVEERARQSSGRFICVLRANGVLAPGSLDIFAASVDEHPDAAVFYTDEMESSRRQRSAVIMKPIFSPERLRCQFYFGDLVFYRRELFIAIGGVDSGLPGAELYDLALRATRAAVGVEHLDRPLFMREGPHAELGEAALESTRVALTSHLAATGGGEVRAVNADGVHDTRRLVVGEPLISIVIPTRGVFSQVDGERRCFVIDAVRSIVDRSTYRNFELVLVVDAVAEDNVIAELEAIAGTRLHLVPWNKPFNFSQKVNLGVLHSRGEFVLLLNDDVDVISPDWLESLLALAQRPGAGMVGGMLYYADDTIQHAGHAYYKGDASHIGLDVPRGDRGPLDGYLVEREIGGVTAACAMMPMSVFHTVGGLSNLLPGNFNDVDLCMKVTWLGYEIYWTPHAELYHFESKTRDASVHAFEVDVAWGRGGFRMDDRRYWPYPLSRPAR